MIIALTVNVLSPSLEPVKELLGVVSRVPLAVGGKTENGQAGALQLFLKSRNLKQTFFRSDFIISVYTLALSYVFRPLKRLKNVKKNKIIHFFSIRTVLSKYNVLHLTICVAKISFYQCFDGDHVKLVFEFFFNNLKQLYVLRAVFSVQI
jgi:hypothetical protein